MCERKEILTIDVVIDVFEEVKGKTGEAAMILFTGSADCDAFKGKILPGGVDTQKEWNGENRNLSARYILEGVDCQGQACRIFIENSGVMDPVKGLEYTVPKILTDSEALAYLEKEELVGTITPTDRGVTIHIFQKENSNNINS
jgi:hypothetical protein